MVIFWVLWMICSASALSGQEKKALDERAYEEWLYLQSECISPDGRWVAYEQRNKMGCRRIVIHGESATDTTSDEKIISYIKNICKRDPRTGRVVTGGIVIWRQKTLLLFRR
mgnify:CR=1 FL=1